MTLVRMPSLLLAALLFVGGCGDPREAGEASGIVTLPGGASDGSTVTVDAGSCVRCHGDPDRTPVAGDAAGVAFAPPSDVSHEASGAKVGAHLAHLRAGWLRGSGVDCSSCHFVPQNGARHTPGVEFRFLAATTWFGPPITPDYDPATGTCSSTYCHGAFPGGNARAVTWEGGPTEAFCGSCHGYPPAVLTDGTTPHPTGQECGVCHAGYPPLDVNPATHVNGQVD